MNFENFLLTDRPVFMQTVEESEQPTINGYTLHIAVDQRFVSIINLKKGGKRSMSIQTIRKALEGLEDVYDQLLEKKANNNAKKDAEKQAIIDRHEAEKQVEFAELDKKYANLLTRIDNAILEASDEVEVEVPDAEPSAEPTTETDAQPDAELPASTTDETIINENEIVI